MKEILPRSCVEQAAQILKNSQYAVAFTGAGISTDSGVPDFRSEESGLWNDPRAMEVATLAGFRRNPQAFYDWVRPLTQVILNARPNAAHCGLASLEDLGLLKAVITQNIDMLHTRAGNERIYELHGQLRQATCLRCFAVEDNLPLIEQFLHDGQTPLCSHCGGVMKPNVILFGEQLPIDQWLLAKEAARLCDVMVIVGSSLEVAPANDLPLMAKRHGAKLIFINLQPTPLDRYADVIIHQRAAEVIPEILQSLETLSA
jgi:NAD-dependent deacetylase